MHFKGHETANEGTRAEQAGIYRSPFVSGKDGKLLIEPENTHHSKNCPLCQMYDIKSTF